MPRAGCHDLVWSLLCMLFLVSEAVSAGTVYVRAGAPSGGDGATWATAYTDLQDALAQAEIAPAPRPEIWIAAGVYRPDAGSGDRAATFELFNGATLIGGFAGVGPNPDARDPVAFPTILSGDIGIPGDATDNSRNVVTFRVFGAAALMDGLIIEAGNADGIGIPSGSGGGLLNEANLTIIQCVFRNNYAEIGGGLYGRFGTPTIQSCRFENNQAEKEGGGAFVRNGGVISDSIFSGNTAAFGGGATICCGPVEVRNSRFSSNFASLGGGLYSALGSVRIISTEFESNTASKGGGAFTAGTGVVVASCFFGNNTATDGGGSAHSGELTIVNTVYSRNSALGSGGAIHTDAIVTIANTTIARSNALLFSGGLYATNATTALSNSILWGNTDSQGPGQNAQIRSLGGSIVAMNNCVQGWNGSLAGAANISQGPAFENPNGPDGLPGTSDDDYRLTAASPCIDAGNNALVPLDLADLDQNGDTLEPTPVDREGLPRFASAQAPILPNPIVDIGAHERQLESVGILGDANGDGVVDFDDITFVLAHWGEMNHAADVSQNGVVDFDDLSIVLSNWGSP